jgi:hemerythrin-like domain-containing protein
MTIDKIEQTIKNCKDMASEDAFNLDAGHFKQVNHERYAQLLEELLRMALQSVILSDK